MDSNSSGNRWCGCVGHGQRDHAKGPQDQNFLPAWTNVDPSQLAKHLSTYTPDMASEISGVSASSIERIAIEFVNNKPYTTISAGGHPERPRGANRAGNRPSQHLGRQSGRPRRLLPATDLRSAGRGTLFPRSGSAAHSVQASRLFAEIWERKLPVQAVMTNGANPVYAYPDPDLTV